MRDCIKDIHNSFLRVQNCGVSIVLVTDNDSNLTLTVGWDLILDNVKTVRCHVQSMIVLHNIAP